MGSYAIPAYLGADAVVVELGATGTAIEKYDFVEQTGANVQKAQTPFNTRPVGIATRDERDSKVQVYIGTDPITVKGASGNTLAVGDDVYLADDNEVEGEPEAVNTAVAIGKVLEIDGDKITFRPVWASFVEGSAAS